MESFNRREHVVAAFLDIEKAFDNVWHNGLKCKMFMLDLPTKRTRWFSDFLVGRVIPGNVNGFLSDKNQSHCRGSTEFCPESIFLMTYQILTTDKTRNPSSLITLLYGLLVKMYNLQQNFCIRTYEN